MAFNLNDLSFHWHGRDRQGVSKWTGSAKPLKWLGWGFGIYGPVAGMVGIGALLYGLITGHFTNGLSTIIAVGLFHGVLFTGIALWSRAMYQHVMRLRPVKQVCADMGIEEAALQRIAAERNIKPRLILNEQPYYDPADFSDALSLLRGSEMPQPNSETLLRPAAVGTATAADELLRGANPLAENVNSGSEQQS